MIMPWPLPARRKPDVPPIAVVDALVSLDKPIPSGTRRAPNWTRESTVEGAVGHEPEVCRDFVLQVAGCACQHRPVHAPQQRAEQAEAAVQRSREALATWDASRHDHDDLLDLVDTLRAALDRPADPPAKEKPDA